MKIYLIAALFLAAFVVAHADDVELPEQDVELPEQPEQQDQPDEEVNDSTEKDEEDEEDTEDSPGTEEDDQESDDDDVEDEEEDPEKRRRRNTLSSISCRRLKRRGYCRRHLFIRRLCAAACYVPICRDKLSRTSCRRLRRTGKCGLSFVRRYCRKTCRICGSKKPCRNYAILNQANRRQSRSNGGLKCDRGGFVKRWYRFLGAAGTKMPTSAPPKNRCGTHAPGWMRGSYPRRNGQVVSRRVCFHWGASKCNWHTQIKVKRCRRGRSYYYVFKLGPTPACHLRYCGNR